MSYFSNDAYREVFPEVKPAAPKTEMPVEGMKADDVSETMAPEPVEVNEVANDITIEPLADKEEVQEDGIGTGNGTD